MNKKLYIAKNSIFFITIILLIIKHLMHPTISLSIGLMYILLIILLIINFLDIKNNPDSNQDTRYNVISIVSYSMVMIILLRSLLDYNIITVKYASHFASDINYSMAFLQSNIIYINIVLCSILLYRISYIMPNITIKIDTQNKSKK